MRYKYRKAVIILALLAAALALPGFAQERPDQKLFQEAKLLIFDGKWPQALDKLDQLQDKYPDSPEIGQALFYRAECLSKLSGREREALRAYKDFLKSGKKPAGEAGASLTEQAERSVIDLAYGLYTRGDKDAIKEVEARLTHSNKAIRYYAAYELSFCKERAVAARSIPVLRGILEAETNPELTDRAKIALMRVDPKALEDAERHPRTESGRHTRILRIKISGTGGEDVNIGIPIALADLALSAISDEHKDYLLRKGYDLDRILSNLERGDGSILEIEDKKEGTSIKIWIEIK